MSVRDNSFMIGEAMRELDYLVPHVAESQGWKPRPEKLDPFVEAWHAFRAAYVEAFGSDAFGSYYPH